MDWSDVPVFLAVAREGTLAAAARVLGQAQPTVGRRLRALEAALGHALFQRTAQGFVPTEEGLAMRLHAERMEAEALALQRQMTAADRVLDGHLRLSCSDWFGVTLLAPVLAEFHRLHPGVLVELLTDHRLYSLPRREADLVFRILPFDEPEVVSRRLMRTEYALYGAPGRAPPIIGDGKDHALVLMDAAFSGMPDVAWIHRLLPHARVAMRSNNREVQARLCALGVGLAVLPRALGDATAGIERIDLGEQPPPRDTWLGYHRDMRRLERLRALIDLVVARLGDRSDVRPSRPAMRD